MKKVITYGTYDYLHRGHIRLLERARALGDYLVVGVTAADFDKVRGKINVGQSLMDRVENVRKTGLADEIIIEEYEGQKIDDIKRLGIDVFTVGSDWVGYFDYLKEYCDVVYLERTQGISSTEIRAEKGFLRLGVFGSTPMAAKVMDESKFVNGLQLACVRTDSAEMEEAARARGIEVAQSYEDLLLKVDAIYLASHMGLHEEHIRRAIEAGVHVLCESPVAETVEGFDKLQELAADRGLVLAEGIKTAYATAYHRLKLLVKSGRIGTVVGVDATATSLRDYSSLLAGEKQEVPPTGSFGEWGPTVLLPAFQLLGTDYTDVRTIVRWVDEDKTVDGYVRMTLTYPHAVATLTTGSTAKAEGSLVITGTKGYVYVPAPWWKTDYFELRFENPANNKRYFYQLDGEGIRNELLCFMRAIENDEPMIYLERETSRAIARISEMLRNPERVTCI